MKQEQRNEIAVKVAELLKEEGLDIFDCLDILQNLEDSYIKELEHNIHNMDGEPSNHAPNNSQDVSTRKDEIDTPMGVETPSPDASKESQIADELNKDYAKTKNNEVEGKK